MNMSDSICKVIKVRPVLLKDFLLSKKMKQTYTFLCNSTKVCTDRHFCFANIKKVVEVIGGDVDVNDLFL